MALPSWPPRVAWGLLAAWLVANLVLFRAEPLGIFPLSAARGASLDRVRSLRARADLAELSRDLERYAATTGDVPTSPEALGPFGRGRHLRDPWGHPYQLRPAAPGVGGGVSLISAGPDGRIGTSDDIVHGDG
ncbi:MAG: type II secretion system protein GspG [candidate division NC10 bacterium]|nr:type II secretion system protein GspG [candidate division NC10 bacterium]